MKSTIDQFPFFGERLEYIPNSELHVTPTKKHVRYRASRLD